MPSNLTRALAVMTLSIVIADFLVRQVDFPNPAAIILLGVVAASFIGGTAAGLIGTIVAAVSALLWFYPLATAHAQMRALTILMTGVIMSLMVGGLRRRSDSLLRREVELEQERRLAAEREKHLEELRKSEERNRAFFELAGAGFAEVDPTTGRFVRVNRSLCTMTGYSEEELLTMTFLDITHPDDRPRAGDEYRQAKGIRQATYETEKRYVCKNGEVKWVHVSIRLVHDPSGNPALSVGIIIDLTRVERANQEVRAVSSKLRRLVDSNIIGILMTQGRGDRDNVEIIEVNDAALAIVGYSRQDLNEERFHWSDLTPAEYRSRDLIALRTADERGSCDPYEKEYVRKDGTRVPVLIGFARLEHSTDQFIAFLLDLTQQKAAEARERAARQEAERANRAKDEFLAVVSHELRTPMTSIVGWSTMLHGSALDEGTRETGWRLLLDAVQKESALIDDLLDFSRAASGRLAIRAEAVDFRNLVHSTIAPYVATAEAHGLRVTIGLPQEPLLVEGDEQRLSQVVSNLIVNAEKFTPGGGRISIALAEESGEAVLRVSDTGRGIKPEFLPHVFDWFTQEDSSLTRNTGGLGLGLAIVRHIVRIHGGRVEAFSAGADQGAEFVVRLPLAAVPEVRTAAELASR